MTWPTGGVSTTNVDATTDDPELGVVDIKSAFDKLNQIIAHVSSFIQGLLDDADATAALATLGAAPLASPVLTGNPTAPTPSGGDNDTSIATTAFVQGEIATKAPLASPVFTGNPTAPTPSGGDNDTSIATTAFVQGELTAKAPLASPVFTGNPTAPTPAGGDNDTSVATTAYVQTELAAKGTVTSGTWTPSLGGTATYSSRSGDWFRIGNLMFVRGALTVGTLGTGSNNTISGLPVASATSVGGTTMAVGKNSGLANAIVSIAGAIASASSSIVFWVRTAANTAANSGTAVFADGAAVEFSGCYLV